MSTCDRCGRKLKAPTETGMGPRCAQYILGRKPKRARAPELFTRMRKATVDERQQRLFLETV